MWFTISLSLSISCTVYGCSMPSPIYFTELKTKDFEKFLQTPIAGSRYVNTGAMMRLQSSLDRFKAGRGYVKDF